MAKRRNTTALFEVIQKDKRFARKSNGEKSERLTTPSWWFKSKTIINNTPPSLPPHAAAPPATPMSPSVAGFFKPLKRNTPAVPSPKIVADPVVAAPPAVPTRIQPVEPSLHASSESVVLHEMVPMTKAAPPPVPARWDRHVADASAPVRGYASEAGRRGMDSAAIVKLLPFRLTLTSGIVALFAVLVAVLVIVIVARRGGLRPVLAGTSTAELRAGPAHPDVADGLDQSDPTDTSRANVLRDASEVTATTGLQASSGEMMNEPKPPVPLVVQDQRRTIGLNYVIVQSYPTAEEAKSACDALIKNGIFCTVEKSLKGWSDWYSVVGIMGFDRISSPEYEKYKSAIEAVGKQFAGTSKFKKFEPAAYRWKGAR